MKIETGRYFARAFEQIVTGDVLISKVFNLLSDTPIFNEAIREWCFKPLNKKTWRNFKYHFQEYHQK